MFQYVNYRTREMTNEERYEGNIRSDFSVKKIPTFDSVEAVRLKMFDNSNPIWVPFIQPEEGVEYQCTTCYDYGGLLATNTCDDEGQPFMQSCPDCMYTNDDL